MKNITNRVVFGWLLVATFVFSAFTGLPVFKPAHQASHREFPFIQQDKNRIAVYNDQPMRRFHTALDLLRTGRRQRVNIVHIGDSHVQADYFPGHLREILQADSLFGNAGRGLVFPYTAVRTNAPDNLKVTYTGTWEGCRNVSRDKACDWGLAGITATTRNPEATLTLDPNQQTVLPYAFTKVTVFCDTRDVTNFQVEVRKAEGVKSTVVGEGFVVFELQQPATRLSLGFQKTDDRQNHFTLQGVVLDNGQRGIQYHAAGVNGAEVTSVLRMPFLERDLGILKPDLVIVSLGTNDAFKSLDAKAFKRNYGELIQRIRRVCPDASVLLTTPGDNLRGRRHANPDNARAAKTITELAEETGSALWDFYEVMGGLGSVRRWHAHRLASPDHVHLNQHGYMLQAELLYDALMADYEANSDFGVRSAESRRP